MYKNKVFRILKRVSRDIGLYGPLSRIRYRFPDYQRELQAEKELYAPFVEPGRLVFDVGANVGRKSQAFLELGASVVAFEPQPDCAEEIELRCGSTENLSVHACAIGADEAKAELDISNRPGLAQITSNSDAGHTITVDVYPLDRFVSGYGMPSFCKIDVEGYELEVLKGLSQLPDALSFEYHATSVKEVEQALSCLKKVREYEKEVKLNYTKRTNTSLQLDSWRSVGEFEKHLRENWRQMSDFGDIFVRQT